MTNRQLHGWLAALMLGAMLPVSAFASSAQGSSLQVPGPAVKAQVLEVKQQMIPVYATFPGTVVATNQVRISSRLSGYVRKIYVHEGQRIKQGQLLLTIDPTQAYAAILQAKAALAKAKAALAEAKANYERYKSLYQQNAVPQQQYQQFELAYHVAQGNYESAKAALANAESQWNYSQVKAPFSGVVVSKLIDAGQLATPGQPLLVLQSSGVLQVQVQVDGQAYRHLRLGQKVAVTFEGSDFKPHTVQGVVERMVAAADPMTHTHAVKINLPPDSGAASGSYARVMIPVGEQEGILVPLSAVVHRAGIPGVFVVTPNGTAQFVMVRVGMRLGKDVIVLSGLMPGDRVIVHADGRLYNGTPIEGVQG